MGYFDGAGVGEGKARPADRLVVEPCAALPEGDGGAADGAGDQAKAGAGRAGGDGRGEGEAGANAGVVVAREGPRVADEVQRVAREVPGVVAQVEHHDPRVAEGFRGHHAAALHVGLAEKQEEVEAVATGGQARDVDRFERGPGGWRGLGLAGGAFLPRGGRAQQGAGGGEPEAGGGPGEDGAAGERRGRVRGWAHQ